MSLPLLTVMLFAVGNALRLRRRPQPGRRRPSCLAGISVVHSWKIPIDINLLNNKEENDE